MARWKFGPGFHGVGESGQRVKDLDAVLRLWSSRQLLSAPQSQPPQCGPGTGSVALRQSNQSRVACCRYAQRLRGACAQALLAPCSARAQESG
jgi:hypothetical protein